MGENSKTIYIEGMRDSHAKNSVEKTLEELKNVTNVNVSLEDRKAVVKSKSEIDDATLTVAIQNAGFKVISIE